MMPSAMRQAAAASGSAMSRWPSWPVITAALIDARQNPAQSRQGEAFGAAEAVPLDQHALAAADQRGKVAAVRGRAGSAQPGGARLDDLRRAAAACAPPAFPAAARTETHADRLSRTRRRDRASVCSKHLVGLGRKARYQIGGEHDIGPQAS